MCVKREESELGMLEVRKTRGLREWGSGAESGEADIWGRRTEGRSPPPHTGSRGLGRCTKESALGMANPLRNLLS